MGRAGKKRSGEELEGEQPSAKRRKLEDGTEVDEEDDSDLPLVPMDMTETSEPTEGGEASGASEADKIPDAEGSDLQTVPIPVESDLVPAPIIPPFEPSIELGELSKAKRRSSTAHTSPAKVPQDLPPITEAEKLKQIQKERRAFLQCKSVENVPVESWQGGQAVRKGKFTREEDKTLIDAADRYLKEKGLTVDEGREKLCSGKYDKDLRKAWLEIARALPGRSIESVYYRGKRVLMKKKTGAWEKEEVDDLLRHVDTIGPKWSKIAEKLGRFESSVRDKYREVSAQRRGGKSGPWTDEEIDNLKRLVEANRVGDDIPWSAISKHLGTRTRSQCRKKWNDSISATKSMRKWEVTDDIDLVQRVYVSGASHNSEINWKDISEGLSWTASQCKKRWMQLSKYTGVDILDFDERLEVIQQILADTAAEQESEDDDSLLDTSAGSTSGADRSSLELSGLVPMGSPSVGGGSPGVVVGGGGDGGSTSGEGGSLGTPGGSGDNSPMRKSKRVTRVKVKDVRKEQQRRRSSAPGSDVSMSSDLGGGSSSGGSGSNGGPSGSSGVDDAVPPIPSSLGEGGAGEGAGEAISGDYDESLVIDDAELQTLAEAAPPSEEELRELAEAGGASAVEGA